MKRTLLLCLAMAAGLATSVNAQNPYLPLWEHLPDGEPRVFEDPDHPGRYRVYIVGSHDLAYTTYCGPDVRMWSAPVDDLTDWRDEGSLFTWFVDGQWDTMYAPDLVEVKEQGKRVYYLYPHSRGNGRVPFVCKGERPDGPFRVVNATPDGRRCLPGSVIDFDPSVFVEPVTDRRDPDSKQGFRAYCYYGFRHSTAIELDPQTLYSVRPGTEVRDYFLPASETYGKVIDPEGTQYPALCEGQNPGEFNFFEASSIRQVGNKYVMVFSGFSGPDYGVSSSNSTLRYAYGDTPLGPWRSGGVLVDSRGIVPSEDGTSLTTTNAGHNTHGSLQQVGDQWYVFYHRPPRGFGFARQAMVAPVKVEWDRKSVAEGGAVRITGYDPFAKDQKWQAESADGQVYRGAEVTSEGFQVYGLPPYRYYSAGYACYLSDTRWMQDSWDCWDNHMDLASVGSGGIIGFKYFGFGGLKKPRKGLPAFEGTKKGNGTQLNVFLTPNTDEAFRIRVMMDGPYANDVWKGQEIAVLNVPQNSRKQSVRLTADVAQAVDGLKGKHAIYLVAEGRGRNLFDLHGLGFSKAGQTMERPMPPTVEIYVGGVRQTTPATPIRSTSQNGYTDASHYELVTYVPEGAAITAKASDPEVSVEVEGSEIRCTWKGQTKHYQIRSETPLKEVFKDQFLVGTALDYGEMYSTNADLQDLIRREFNAVVPGNCMKADHTEPREGQFNFADGDRFLDLAERNGQVATGHCLVWHSKCPSWMFVDSLGRTVSREELIRRMRNHIYAVAGHYKGRVRGWDVVNEAIEGDGSFRRSPYYTIIGEDFIRLAFQFAHEADPDAELYYNDYGMDSPAKREAVVRLVKDLKAHGLRIDAVGMQSHLSLWTNLAEYEKSMEAFAAAGVKVMVTELDVSVLPWPSEMPNADISTRFEYAEKYNPYRKGLPKEVEKRLGETYTSLFKIYLRHADDLTRVTFWGVHDGGSWLNNFPIRGVTNYPLLFDRSLKRKPFVADIVNLKP